MGKSKCNNTTKMVSSALPIAPWIYLNDPLDHAAVAAALTNLIPDAATFPTETSTTTIKQITDTRCKNVVVVLSTNYPDACTEAKRTIEAKYREAAITHGCNFTSINVTYSETQKTASGWGTNHLEVSAFGLTPQNVAEKIYKWLFGVLSVPETLHLIPEKEMMAVDTKSFPDYEYCAIADSRKRSKDAKIQFVALVTSKPTVGAGKKLHWTVADRTGVANFYFQWRGPESKYTWDWVLKLQLGERKALPRMPAVEVKERKRVTVAKAPFRAVGFVVGGTGHAIKSFGQGLYNISNKVKMGARSEWVPEADVKIINGRAVKAVAGNGHGGAKEAGGKTEIKIFDEKGHKLWKDADGDASTTASSIFDEKVGKEFF